MSPHVLVEQHDRVLLIRINRPEKKNALSLAMYGGLTAALTAAETNPAVRVVVITGAEACFTAGNDLADFANSPLEGDDSPAPRFIRAIANFPKPLLAAVEGVAVGVGVTMLLHCEIAIAGQSTRFSLPFVNLGLLPEAASSLLLPLAAGYHKAAGLLLTGEPFGAAVALECGIVNAVVQDGAALDAVLAKAADIAAKPPEGVRITKRLMRSGLGDLNSRLTEEHRLFAERLRSPEAREAFAAFFEKRKPDFSKFE